MSTSPHSDPISIDAAIAPPNRSADDTLPEGTVELVEESTTLDTSLHWSMLVGASCVLLLAAVLQVRGPETVVIPLVDMPLPGTCTYKQYMGMECPGCGLTRCFISLAHGRPSAAWSFNPAGVLFFALVAVQIPFRAIQIWRIRRGLGELRVNRLAHYLTGTLIVALLSQWLLRSMLG